MTDIAEALNNEVPAAKTLPLEGYVQQTFSSISDVLRSTAVIAIVLGLFVVALITTLFLRLVLVQEWVRSGILRILGFSPVEMSAQTLVKAIVGIVVGVIVRKRHSVAPV